MGATLINKCFEQAAGLGDPCNKVVDYDVACVDMLEGSVYIGVGYDGRGDYTSNDRKKSLIQRKCGSKNFYQGEQVPDVMNVCNGVCMTNSAVGRHSDLYNSTRTICCRILGLGVSTIPS